MVKPFATLVIAIFIIVIKKQYSVIQYDAKSVRTELLKFPTKYINQGQSLNSDIFHCFQCNYLAVWTISDNLICNKPMFHVMIN